MTHPLDFDSIDIDELRTIGSVKWSVFPETIGAFVAEMDFGVAPEIRRAIHEGIDRGLTGYLPKSLAAEMSEAAAHWQRTSYGWDVQGYQVHPIADVIKGYEVAIRHYSRPGSPIIVPTPSYMPFLSVPRFEGRETMEVPMHESAGSYSMDLDAVEKAFQMGGNLLVLCNPFNPVGRVFTREELLAISEVVSRHGGRVFSDEIHAPLVFAGARHVPYASISRTAASHTVTATSASKAWNLAGLKGAQFITTNDADASIWEEIGEIAGHGASNLGVIANTVAYESGGDWLNHVVTYLDGNRKALSDLLEEHIPAIRYVQPEGTYIAWLDCRELSLGVDPARFFRENAGVAMTEGSDCGAPGYGHTRFILATPRPILERALKQMAMALAPARRH